MEFCGSFVMRVWVHSDACNNQHAYDLCIQIKWREEKNTWKIERGIIVEMSKRNENIASHAHIIIYSSSGDCNGWTIGNSFLFHQQKPSQENYTFQCSECKCFWSIVFTSFVLCILCENESRIPPRRFDKLLIRRQIQFKCTEKNYYMKSKLIPITALAG